MEKNSVYSMFQTMAIVDMSKAIGISTSILRHVSNGNENVLDEEQDKKIDDLISQVELLVKDETFKKLLLIKLNFLKGYGRFQVTNNTFIGKYENKKEKYSLDISVIEDEVSFISVSGESLLSGKLIKKNDGTMLIEYFNVHTTIYNHSEEDSYNIVSEKVLQSFDKNGIEQVNYEETKKENYLLNRRTKEKTINPFNPFENYKEKVYKFRAPNNVIVQRRIMDYTIPTDYNRDDYYLAENVKPNDKLLPFGGHFNWVSKEIANAYYNDEEKFEEVLDGFQRVISK